MFKTKIILIVFMLSLFGACAKQSSNTFTDVYVADFHSDEIEFCKPSDVDLSHPQAKTFFERSKVVTSRELHDHYDHAPCYIEGTLKKGAQVCDWQIRAGATGHIQCGDSVELLACDTCDDLFKP